MKSSQVFSLHVECRHHHLRAAFCSTEDKDFCFQPDAIFALHSFQRHLKLEYFEPLCCQTKQPFEELHLHTVYCLTESVDCHRQN